MRKDNTPSNDVYTVEKVEKYGEHMEAWCTGSNVYSRWVEDLVYEFHPITGGRRKSRILKKLEELVNKN